MNSGKTEFLGLIRSHPSTPLPPCHGECIRVRGPELKTGLSLPYLGVRHRHSLPVCVFLSSLGLMHTLPSFHNLYTSLCLYPPPLHHHSFLQETLTLSSSTSLSLLHTRSHVCSDCGAVGGVVDVI